MSLVVSQTGPGGRVGELALWGAAGLLMLTVHFSAAAYLMREQPDVPADNAPPAAIMIELAPEPEAANTEEEQISPDMQEQEQVMSEQAEPVEEPQPEPVEQPRPEPTPEPVAEPVEQPVEPPLQEVAEPVEPEPVQPPVAEPPPEPIEEIKPVEEQMTAALENVEVPLPVVRPLPPPVAEKPPEQPKKPEPRKEPVKKVQKPKQQQQARPDMAEAKIQAKQSDRTAASQNSTSLFSSSVSPQQWMTRVRTKIARYARKCPGNGTGIVTVRFSFDGSGNIGNVSVAGSSGNASIDDYVASAVRRASPIPAPPSGVASSLSQPVKCE
ncbi:MULTISPECIES: cell envelope integrity protein TolA [unclassified Neorhizobium]|uniref:cell envelope integrity protein TolA n=1 Tax=unclassified Neorhizobium TaxID=2629175 RepID=UPI001FF4C919|nr:MULTISPECIES: cell envelope integrity protein TolA [unclassified Neorhizobium]MCJ9674819.1 cell envelope integrity protein TolA [Neorhizobium sp. SHOUNA12B]MCJ9747813.1 cell envelope integrity protein TolA [Neorhizobium sp. SHOUNA12A]